MKVWIFGDSFTDGTFGVTDWRNPALTKSWIDIICENNNINYENLSRSGQSNEGIYLSVIDTLPRISTDDYVIISWSSNMRFLNLTDKDEFTRYIDSPSNANHYNIWDPTCRLDMNTISELNPELSCNLKFSICCSGMEAILKQHGIKFSYIMGHMEFHNELDEYTDRMFPMCDERLFRKTENNYFNKDNFIKLNYGYSLVNEFYMKQIEHTSITDSEILKIIKRYSRRDDSYDYVGFSKKMLNLMNRNNECIFYDNWHLNYDGHRVLAKTVNNKVIKSIKNGTL